MLALAAGSAGASPQWQEQTFSPSQGAYPVDCATTPSNNRGAARYASPISNSTILSVWKPDAPFTSPALLATFGGGTLKSGNQTTVNLNNLRAYQPSDRIELTNSMGVSIGSGDSNGATAVVNDETYVEFFDLSSSPPAFVNQYVYSSSSSSYNYDHAGLANDLAITRDSEWVVVNSDNWIHLYNVGSFPGTITPYAFNIGDVDYSQTPPQANFNRPCSPNLAVDSVAVTSERAVVTTARLSPTFGTYTTWVYIIDLTASPPAIVLQQEITPPATWMPEGDDYDRPHDIAITPPRIEDRIAIVTTTHGVAAFDLRNNVLLNKFFDEDDWRFYQKQVDSVELTDQHALVIADHGALVGGMRWQVQDFLISATVGLIPNGTYKPGGTNPPESHAHDLAIDQSFDKAIVRASKENVIFTGLSTTTVGFSVLTSPNSSDAYAYEQFPFQYGINIFSSDAAVICPETNGSIFAVTIGGYVDPVTLLWDGAVDVIDLNAATSVAQVQVTSNGMQHGCIPVDLAIAVNHNEVVVRSADPNVDVSPATGPDLVRISLSASPSITASYGGSGTVMGLDSLAIQTSGFVSAAKRILSISEQELTSTGNDYTHINK